MYSQMLIAIIAVEFESRNDQRAMVVVFRAALHRNSTKAV